MATYAIGDPQGCFVTLRRLLERIDFRPEKDRVWIAGDLVNRGTGSLDVLRYVRDLGESAVTVLGNHDVHLLRRALTFKDPKPLDTLDEVLAAPDRHDLIAWLRARPLLHHENDLVLVHAGLLPEWSVGEAEALAAETETVLQSEAGLELLARPTKNMPRAWDPKLRGLDRAQLVLGAMTLVRTLEADGSMDRDFSGPPAEAPPGRVPWYAHPARRSTEATLLFGHWSALGFLREEGLWGLDTGCVWGRQLTAVCLDDGIVFAEPAAPEDLPSPDPASRSGES